MKEKKNKKKSPHPSYTKIVKHIHSCNCQNNKLNNLKQNRIAMKSEHKEANKKVLKTKCNKIS